MALTFKGFLVCKEFIDNSKSPKNSFYRVTLAVQEGYAVSLHKLYIFNDEAMKKMTTININSGVTAKGYASSNDQYNVATAIEVTTHSLCPECGIIEEYQDAQGCSGCQRPKQEKIAGTWELTDRSELPKKVGVDDTPAVKLFFKQQENLLCFVTFPNSPHFEMLSKMKAGKKIELNGWRNEKRHTTLWKLNKELKRKRV